MRKKDTVAVLGAAAVILVVAFIVLSGNQPVQNEAFCKADSDCACGANIKTGECFYGNKDFVDTKKQCPDFCSGFAGNLEIKCVNNECAQAAAR